MKKRVVFYFAAILMLTSVFSKCKDKATKPPDVTKGDTLLIYGIYPTPEKDKLLNGEMFRVIRPSINIDSSTKELSWKIDSFYFRPVMDTLRDSLTRKPLFDDKGVVKLQKIWPEVSKKWVYDTGITVDSINSWFNKKLVSDTAKKK